MPILEIRNARLAFGGLTVLAGLDLTVEKNFMLGLVGTNGSGKTTLLNAIGGQLALDAGSVQLNGRDITRKEVWARAHLGIARVFQESRLWRPLTIGEHLLLAPKSGQSESDVADILSLLELTDEVTVARPAMLTLMTRRRVELALSLLNRPSLLLVDEIAAGLNAAESHLLYGYIGESLKRKIVGAVVAVEHKLDILMSYATDIALLDGGKIARRVPAGQNSAWLSETLFPRNADRAAYGQTGAEAT